MNDFNLIVSTYRFREEEALDEILELLEKFGDPDAESEITQIKGIILVKTSIDPADISAKLKELVSREPWQVRYVLRVIPVQTVVSSEPASISNAARKLAASISNDDTYRITVEKRHSKLSSTEIIASIANDIHSKVDLESPSWVVLVQILGAQAGISVLRPEAVFSSVIEKRK